LLPSRRTNELIIGALARAQKRYAVDVIAVVVLSNHLHLLVRADDAEQLAAFMRYAESNIAREIGRLHGWDGRFWQVRYRPVVITEEESAQVARLRYLLAQGCKEDLVASPLHWPGVHSAREILAGRPHRGVWVDRTALGRARRRAGKKTVRAIDFEQPDELVLSPLPCWAHLSPEAYRQQVAALVQDIEAETKARHLREGTRCAGRKAVQKMHPHHRPKKAKESIAPRVHAATRKAREAYLAAYRWFVQAFRAASEKLREGHREVLFPEGSFPPGLPFVRPGLGIPPPS